MSTRDWRRLAHIREQQERMARLNLATAAGKLREALYVQDVFRDQAAAAERVWQQLLAGSVQSSHWAAMATFAQVQQGELRNAEQLVRQSRANMERVGELHRDTVIDEE